MQITDIMDFINYSDEELFRKVNECLIAKKVVKGGSKNLEDFKNSILSRIRIITNKCKYFYFEEEYTDHFWKEIYSHHYSNTNYTKHNQAMRIHFFNKNFTKYNSPQERIDESYLGYVTLRPVKDFHLMISMICPNWDYLKISDSYEIMTYQKAVHVGPFETNINTFDFFSQDSVYTICAHADIMMFSTFLNRKYNYKRLKIKDIIESSKYVPLPNPGLSYEGIQNIFCKNDIPFQLHFKPKLSNSIKQQNKRKRQQLKDIESKCYDVVEMYINSKLPVIVYNNKHVVVIIGIAKDEYNKKYFIVYDDSGSFIYHSNYYRQKDDYSKDGSSPFVEMIPYDELFPPNNNLTFFFGATHERVLINPDEYKGLLQSHLIFLKNQNIIETTDQNILQPKSYIIENEIIKKILYQSVESSPINSKKFHFIKTLINSNLPHYLWCTEIRLNHEKLFCIADPTFPVNTTSEIFIFHFTLQEK